jgi:hypothetical protein
VLPGLQHFQGKRACWSSKMGTRNVATPLWSKCEDETRTPKSGNLESSETLETSKFDRRGQNTSPWGILYVLERFWSVDVKNGLTWAIQTSATQVMVERKAGSQIGSLIPNH